MSDKKKLIQITDELNDVRIPIEQATQLASVLNDNYFIYKMETKEMRAKWGETSYLAVQALFTVVSEYTCKACHKLYEIQDEIENMLK